MGYSSLVDRFYDVSNPSIKKYGSRNGNKILKITPHHMAGDMKALDCAKYHQRSPYNQSANYYIGSAGDCVCGVDEAFRPFTSGSKENDEVAVTIEVANNSGAPNWTVSDKAYAKLIDLCVDICQRNGIKEIVWTGDKTGNLTCHYMFQATLCCGPYLKAKMPDIANQINARLNAKPVPVPDPQPIPQNKFIEEVAKYVNQYREKYNISVASPIIAQAINESSMGTSELATKAQNYFGLKYRENRCPTSNGVYVKDATEQMANGTYIVSGNTKWFKFPNLEKCVIGYFDFTNIANYYNLKGVTDPQTYLFNIKADGYASDNDYVNKCMKLIKTYNLTQYDTGAAPVQPATEFPYLVKIATDVLNVRGGAGTNYPIKTTVRRGQVYTIMEEVNGWGRLKSGAGWICLAYTTKQ